MSLIKNIEEVASKASPQMPGDYERDGLLYCGKCHEPKQCRISFDGNEKVVSCSCSCTAKEPDNKERIEQL